MYLIVKKKMYRSDFNFHFYFPIWCLCLRILSLIFSFMCAHSCPSLSNPMDCSPPGSSVHGIFQARILEWVAISFLGDLPNPGIKPMSLTLAGRFFTAYVIGEAPLIWLNLLWIYRIKCLIQLFEDHTYLWGGKN